MVSYAVVVVAVVAVAVEVYDRHRLFGMYLSAAMTKAITPVARAIWNITSFWKCAVACSLASRYFVILLLKNLARGYSLRLNSTATTSAKFYGSNLYRESCRTHVYYMFVCWLSRLFCFLFVLFTFLLASFAPCDLIVVYHLNDTFIRKKMYCSQREIETFFFLYRFNRKYLMYEQ